jgi:hypothetical protein
MAIAGTTRPAAAEIWEAAIWVENPGAKWAICRASLLEVAAQRIVARKVALPNLAAWKVAAQNPAAAQSAKG